MKIEFDSRYEIFEFDKEALTREAFQALKDEIRRLKVDINVHSIGIPDAEDLGGYCIHQEDDVWLVYHSERGRRSRPAIFTSPFDAANFYLWCHISHPSNGNTDVGMLPVRRAL
jgi:hypothetical protein